MHLIIISAATRPQTKSNTAKIIAAFQQGYEQQGNTSEVWYLSDRKQWKSAAAAFEASTEILIAFPLYVENVPCILLEFLSGLKVKEQLGTKIAFLCQGGFPEAAQSRCCEAYLETLPMQLGCAYGGTLIKGDMFGVSLVDEKNRQKMLSPFTEMGKHFARTGIFDKPTVDSFAAPEVMSPKKIRAFNLIGRHVSRFFMNRIAKGLGCNEPLDTKPYSDFVN